MRKKSSVDFKARNAQLFRNRTPENTEKIILLNQPLVIAGAKRYARQLNRSRQQFNDLVQQGNIGLCKAIDRFDPKRGIAFATYAPWWIRASIQRYVAENSGSLGGRLPSRDVLLLVQLYDTEEQFFRQHHRTPTEHELRRLSGLEGKTFSHVMHLKGLTSMSLDSPDEDGNLRLHETISGAETPEETITNDDRQRKATALVREAIGHVRGIKGERHAVILEARYQLRGPEPLSLSDLGKEFGLSRERIRQILLECEFLLRRHFRDRMDEIHALLKAPDSP